MNFTIHNDDSINFQIEKHLSCISRSICSLLPVRALILYGAFGRGEGRVVINRSDIRIINDLDIMAIIDGNVKEVCREWKKVQTKLQDSSPVFIDIKPMSYDELRRLKFTMDNFDLKNGGYVFWGDSTVLDKIPSYDGRQMPKIQSRRLLFNRLITFLEARGNLVDKCLEGSRASFCNYQSSKVVMACVDAYLILAGKYTTRYIDKYEHFRIMNSNDERIGVVQQALEIKIGQGNVRTTGAIDFWEQTGRFFLQTIQDYFAGEKEFPRVLSGKSLLRDIYRVRERNFLKYWLKCLLRRNRTARQYLETIELLILYSLFDRVDYTEDIQKWLVEYGKHFDISIDSESLSDIENLYPLVLKLWYDKFHLSTPTYELWK